MNCKPGDLAILIHSDVSSNIGLLFEVISWDGLRNKWLLKALSKTSIGANTKKFVPYGYAFDHNLKPVSGIPDFESLKITKDTPYEHPEKV